MDIKVGSRWLNKKYKGVCVVVVAKNSFGYLTVDVSTPSSQYQGKIDRPGLLSRYSLDEGWVVGEVLRKYCENGE
jgi:hypothetical protein